MKNLFIVLLVFGLVSFASCKKSEGTSDDKKSDTTEEVKSTEDSKVTKDSKSSDASVPSFKNDDVNAFVKDYAAYMDEYLKAAKSNDASALQALTEKGTALTQKMSDLQTKLETSEVEKFNTFLTEQANRLQEAYK